MLPVSPKLVREISDVVELPAKILVDESGPALILKSEATVRLNVVACVNVPTVLVIVMI